MRVELVVNTLEHLGSAGQSLQEVFTQQQNSPSIPEKIDGGDTLDGLDVHDEYMQRKCEVQ